MACHSNRAFAAARNHIATNMGLFIVNLRPKWRNNKAIYHQFEIRGTVAALRHFIVWEGGSGGGEWVVEAPAAARRDPLPWLVNTRPWSWNLGSSRSYIQHNHGPFILLQITLPLPKVKGDTRMMVFSMKSTKYFCTKKILTNSSKHSTKL